MKQIIALLAAFLILSACQEQTEEQIREEILTKKEEVAKIQAEIKELEDKLPKHVADASDATVVKMKEMTAEMFEHFFEASGSVEAVNAAYISPEVNGQIKKIHVHKGDRVSAGQVLVTLNDDMLRKSIDEVRTAQDLANTLFEKQQSLWDKKIGSEMQYLEAKNRKESLDKKMATLNSQLALAQVKAPFAGIVDEIYRKEGELAMPGAQLIQLIDLSEIYVNADISENYLASVKMGSEIEVSFPTYPDMKVPAKIENIGNVINPANRTFAIRIKLANPEGKLKPNIISVVRIRDFSTDAALVVPSIVIRQDTNGSFVYVAETTDGKLVAAKKYITTGLSYNDVTMIADGIAIGDKVLVEGYNLVTSGQALKAE